MTEQDKVTVDDIIGIVKTEEQTNSVEEVRKLRGRENKTAKRFTLKEYTIGDYAILDNGTEIAYASYKSAFTFCELLNKLHEENEEKKRAMRIAEHYNKQLENENKKLKKYIDSISKGGLE